jgi:hypothetical protein
MIRADIYSIIDYLQQKKIVDRLRFSALLEDLFVGCGIGSLTDRGERAKSLKAID